MDLEGNDKLSEAPGTHDNLLAELLLAMDSPPSESLAAFMGPPMCTDVSLDASLAGFVAEDDPWRQVPMLPHLSRSMTEFIDTSCWPLPEVAASRQIVYQPWPSSSYLHCLPFELRLTLARYFQHVDVSELAGLGSVMALDTSSDQAGPSQCFVTARFGKQVKVGSRLGVELEVRKSKISAAAHCISTMSGVVTAQQNGTKLSVKWRNQNQVMTDHLACSGKGCTMVYPDPVPLPFVRHWPEQSEDAAIRITMTHMYLGSPLQVTFTQSNGCA
jgi:hypothetical protein